MRKKRLVSAVLLVLLLAGCGQTGGKLLPSGTGRTDTAAAQAELDVQLGLLKDEITAEERREALDLWSKIRAIQTERKAKGNYERSDYEWRLLRRLSGLYDAYTIRYLGGDEEGFGYRSPRERTLAVYQIGAGGALTPDPANDLSGGAWSETELLGLWEEMCTLLPEGAFEGFDQFTVFTDGPEETVAYVWALDDAGARWEIAVDPADAEDREYFVETVLHEYFHYLSLNDTQVIYTSEQTLDTYNEPGMVTLADSYLNDFYQEFWTGYLDDCLACDDTYNFSSATVTISLRPMPPQIPRRISVRVLLFLSFAPEIFGQTRTYGPESWTFSTNIPSSWPSVRRSGAIWGWRGGSILSPGRKRMRPEDKDARRSRVFRPCSAARLSVEAGSAQ